MGLAAIGSGIAFGLALGLLMGFFLTKDARLDRVAEWCFVVFAILAVPTALAVAAQFPDAGYVISIATVIGIGGAVALGLGELASALRLIDFRRIAPIVTLGFLAYLAWIVVISLLIVTQDGALPAVLGWLGILATAWGIAMVAWIARTPGVIGGTREPSRGQVIWFMAPVVGMVAWLILLGFSL